MTLKLSQFLPLALIGALATVGGCKPSTTGRDEPASGSPGERFVLSDHGIDLVEKRAKDGDVTAMLTLVRHYERTEQSNKVEHWLREAVVKGDVSAMQNLAVLITVRPDEQRCREAEALLERGFSLAKDSAQREELQITLDVFRQGFRGEGACVRWLGSPNRAGANNSFKPKPLRGSA